MERAKGFEPSTPTLARLCSTPELRPLERLRRKVDALPTGVRRAVSTGSIPLQPENDIAAQLMLRL